MSTRIDDLSAALSAAVGKLKSPSANDDIEGRVAEIEAYLAELYDYLVDLAGTPLDQRLPQPPPAPR